MPHKYIFYLAPLAAQFHKFSRWWLLKICMTAISALRYPLLQVGFSFGGLITLIQRLYHEKKLYLLTSLLAATHSLITSLTWPDSLVIQQIISTHVMTGFTKGKPTQFPHLVSLHESRNWFDIINSMILWPALCDIFVGFSLRYEFPRFSQFDCIHIHSPYDSLQDGLPLLSFVQFSLLYLPLSAFTWHRFPWLLHQLHCFSPASLWYHVFFTRTCGHECTFWMRKGGFIHSLDAMCHYVVGEEYCNSQIPK